MVDRWRENKEIPQSQRPKEAIDWPQVGTGERRREKEREKEREREREREREKREEERV